MNIITMKYWKKSIISFVAGFVEYSVVHRTSVFPSSLTGNSIFLVQDITQGNWERVLFVLSIWITFLVGLISTFLVFSLSMRYTFVVGVVTFLMLITNELLYVYSNSTNRENIIWHILLVVFAMSLQNTYSYFTTNISVLTLITGNITKIVNEFTSILILKKTQKIGEMIILRIINVVSVIFGFTVSGVWTRFASNDDRILLLPAILSLISSFIDYKIEYSTADAE